MLPDQGGCGLTDDTRSRITAIVAGLGETLWGGVRAPFDRGETLLRGLKGTVVSLPELAFVSLRKGSLEYGPSDPPRTLLAMVENPGTGQRGRALPAR